MDLHKLRQDNARSKDEPEGMAAAGISYDRMGIEAKGVAFSNSPYIFCASSDSQDLFDTNAIGRPLLPRGLCRTFGHISDGAVLTNVDHRLGAIPV